MPQLLAVAYAAFEDHFVNGWDEPRGKVRDYLIAQDVLAELPPDNNPFGPDPALLASIGHGDTATYTATARLHQPDQTIEGLPPAPATAGGT